MDASPVCGWPRRVGRRRTRRAVCARPQQVSRRKRRFPGVVIGGEKVIITKRLFSFIIALCVAAVPLAAEPSTRSAAFAAAPQKPIVTISFASAPCCGIAATVAAKRMELVFEYGRERLGSSRYYGYCQRLVREMYEQAGIETPSGLAIGSAMDAWRAWCVVPHTKGEPVSDAEKRAIPIGATVYFDTGRWGHVGVVVAKTDTTVVILHALATVREEPISANWWERYIGWGWQGGRAWPQPQGTVAKTYRQWNGGRYHYLM